MAIGATALALVRLFAPALFFSVFPVSVSVSPACHAQVLVYHPENQRHILSDQRLSASLLLCTNAPILRLGVQVWDTSVTPSRFGFATRSFDTAQILSTANQTAKSRINQNSRPSRVPQRNTCIGAARWKLQASWTPHALRSSPCMDIE